MALAVLAISACGDVADGTCSAGCLEALYFSQHIMGHVNATMTKFGASRGDAAVEHHVTEELYTKDPGEAEGELPVDEFEPNGRSEGCKAPTYLQAQNVDGGCEAALYSQAHEEVKARYMEIVYVQVSLAKNDLMTLSRSLQKYVIEIMGYSDFIVHQLFIKGKTM